jgi:tectonin beta-propeller repeat-containing protein 1
LATDSDGFVLACFLDELSVSSFKWSHLPSDEKFMNISIGVNYKIWAVDMNGNVYFRMGSNESNPTGSSWEMIKLSEIENRKENLDIKFKMVCAGNSCVWAISHKDELYFRENITKSFPQGTSWTKIDNFIKYVTVNYRNEVFAITAEKASKPDCLLYRDNVGPSNLKGNRWLECINVIICILFDLDYFIVSLKKFFKIFIDEMQNIF